MWKIEPMLKIEPGFGQALEPECCYRCLATGAPGLTSDSKLAIRIGLSKFFGDPFQCHYLKVERTGLSARRESVCPRNARLSWTARARVTMRCASGWRRFWPPPIHPNLPFRKKTRL